MARAEQLTGPEAQHGEGPCWWDGWGGLRYVDMLAGDVLTLDPVSGAVTRQHVGRVAAVIRPRSSGGAVVALENTFALTANSLAELHPVASAPADPKVRFNDGGCDPDGNFYCGTMAWDETPHAGLLYRLDTTHRVSTTLRDLTISNGFDFSVDNTVAYYIDSVEHGIDRFDYSSSAGLTGRRRWVDIPPEAGTPDGLVVDAEGGVWVAMMGGGAVHRYAPEGRLDAVVAIPVSGVTACTFGGPQLDELFVTTSRLGADLESQPQSGALFRVHPGIRGRRVLTFAG